MHFQYALAIRVFCSMPMAALFSAYLFYAAQDLSRALVYVKEVFMRTKIFINKNTSEGNTF